MRSYPYGLANFVLADGSVRFLSAKISPEVMRALGTPQGGETIDPSMLKPAR